MFAPPTLIETSVWARLPDRFRETEPRPGFKATRFPRQPHSFLEGPSFDRKGNLYLVDVPFGRVFRISPEGEFVLVTEYDGEPNGLKIHRDGRIFVADWRRGIMEIDPDSGQVTPVLTEHDGEPLKGPNDLVFSSAGDLFFTDQGLTSLADPTGRVMCLRVGGAVEVVADGLPSPNGLVFNAGESALFVAVTRANAIWRIPTESIDGHPPRTGVAIVLSGGHGPDGLAMAEDDTLFVAHPALGAVWGFSRLGEPLYRIRSCAGADVTNLTFGGPDRRSLYIVESHSGSVLKADLPVSGRAMFSHR